MGHRRGLARAALSIVMLAAGWALAQGTTRVLPPPSAKAAFLPETSPRLLGFNRDFLAEGLEPLSSTELRWVPANGGHLGRFVVRSEGARALRLAITPSSFAHGVEMRFREPGRPHVSSIVLSLLGAHEGLIWGPIVAGHTAEVEVFVPEHLDVTRELFRISRLSHFHEHPARAAKAAAPCHRDVACYSLREAPVKSTLFMGVTAADGQSWGCTGTLMNTTTSSFQPYVLTHSRCVRDAAEAASVNTYYDYEVTACGGAILSGSYTTHTGGAVLLSRNAGQGAAMILLNERAPGSSWFAGWFETDRPVGTAVHAVHHPGGDPKKVSVGSIVAGGSELLVRFSSGITEGTSLGSGIFEDERRLIGILDRTESSCANPSAPDAYRPFASILPGLETWLRPSSQPPSNLSDIWWNPNESGWGVTLADHETQMFAVWYTYRADGSPTWYVIPGGTFTENRRRFSGDAYRTTGPPYNSAFSSRPVTVTRVGSVSFDFAPPGLATGTALFNYTIEGISGTKQIQRQPFGNAPANWGTDLTDLWWDPAESGWGLSINQHGNNVFAVWYTYDAAGQPLFIVMPGVSSLSGATFTGDAYTTRGPWFGGPFNSAQVQVIPFGDMTVDLSGSSSTQMLAKIWRPRSGKMKVRTRTNGNIGDVHNKVIKQQRYGYDAPATPPVPCIPTYGAWSSCQGDGFEYRLRISTSPPNCPSEAVEFRPCSGPAQCQYTYSNWSECQNGVRTRQVTSATPQGCTGTPGPLSEQCTTLPPLCTYSVGEPCSACVSGSQMCTVNASPAGCRPNNPPTGVRACSDTPPVHAICSGTGTITLSGVLRDRLQSQICPNPFQNFPPQPVNITIQPESWTQTTPQFAQVHVDRGHWICGATNRPEPIPTFELPTVTLVRSGSGYTGSGYEERSSGRFDIGFTVVGRNVSGTISKTHRQHDADWSYTGTFSCTY